jgi:hypothetical protein
MLFQRIVHRLREAHHGFAFPSAGGYLARERRALEEPFGPGWSVGPRKPYQEPRSGSIHSARSVTHTPRKRQSHPATRLSRCS